MTSELNCGEVGLLLDALAHYQIHLEDSRMQYEPSEADKLEWFDQRQKRVRELYNRLATELL